VEGLSKPLTLNLTGSCVQIAPQKESINFEASVRTRESKQITITNRTNSSWELKPLIEGEFFSGLESFVIEPQSSASYEVIYHPLTMTSVESKQKHVGSVFFPLPDGTGLMYMLSGVANPPKHIARVLRENIPCKTNHVEVLSIENWLKKPQRFKVCIFYYQGIE
jgi:hydrocephalus-inducing protein